MAEREMDISKVLAVLAQPKEVPKPLEHVKRMRIEVRYIRKDEVVEKRYVNAVLPEDAKEPMPLIFVPHYPMGEDALEMRDYLSRGWAVASPEALKDESHRDDEAENDLVFNNAALYELRHTPEFDKDRIILIGGSAGGYTTLLLNGLQLGICASIANGPITNTYFSLNYYVAKANRLNQSAMAKIVPKKKSSEAGDKGDDAIFEEKLSLLEKIKDLPLPFVAMLTGMSIPDTDHFSEADYKKFEEVSPVGIADRFSSPIMINHCTSDVLVPVDQITKKFTYAIPGKSLPKDFDMRIPEDFPGKFGKSLEECLPEDEVRTRRIIVPKEDHDEAIPFDADKKFNINIYDDGPAEGYGTHSSRMDAGRRVDVDYVNAMFEKSAVKTCRLTPGMLEHLLDRYMGKSISLPPHKDGAGDVYGSLTVYQQEIVEELRDWEANQEKGAVRKVFEKLMQGKTERSNKDEMTEAMNEIMSQIE